MENISTYKDYLEITNQPDTSDLEAESMVINGLIDQELDEGDIEYAPEAIYVDGEPAYWRS